MGTSKRPGREPSFRRLRLGALVASGMLLIGIAGGCSETAPVAERPDPSQMVDSGSWYVKEAWPHDGNPHETEHFVVYSDGATQEARRRVGALAEQVWGEVIDEMGVDPVAMFKFPAGQDKIDLYTNRYHVLEGGGARAYYAGVIIASFDNEVGEPTDTGTVRVNLKHELVHVAEALLKGRFVGDVAVGDPRRMPVWFSEGTAEAISGGSTGGAPRTLDQMYQLMAEYGNINPVSWQVDIPFSDLAPGAYPNYYYPMAQLAVEYLLDSRGLGRSPKDLAAVMLDMGDNVPFSDAFAAHMGISERDYETRFFTSMVSYLPQSEFPVEAVALGLMSVLAAAALGGTVVWGVRRSPATVSAPGVPMWTRRARRGFVAEASVLALVAAGLIARALFSIAFDDLPAGANRSAAYAVTGGYFVVSVAAMSWATRRWNSGSRRAYLIPLLVIGAAVVAVVAIARIL